MTDLMQYLAVCVLFALLSIGLFFLLADKRKRSALANVLSIPGRRRHSTSGTPPRHLSPPEKESKGSAAQGVDYTEVFPPSSRDGLKCLAVKHGQTYANKFRATEVSSAELTKNIIPFEADFRECGPSTLTPTSITLDEVRALGDFPDYAELSGVPLPQSYDGFRLETAIHRPYRPFRWAYHQTMCKSHDPVGSQGR